MRKLTIIAAAALALAVFPLGAVAAPPGPPTAKPSVHWFAGAVTAASDSSLGVDVLWTGKNDGSLNGQSVSVALDSSTQIVYGKGHTSIQPGDLVTILAKETDGTLATLTAKRVHVRCNCHWVGGTIGAIGSSSITVQVKRTGPYDTVLKGNAVTIQVNGSTTYIKGRDKTQISFSDLKVGDGVGVVFAADGFFQAPGFDWTKATFTAARVHLWGQKQVPPASSDAGAAASTTP